MSKIIAFSVSICIYFKCVEVQNPIGVEIFKEHEHIKFRIIFTNMLMLQNFPQRNKENVKSI